MSKEKEAGEMIELGSLSRGDMFNAGGKNFIVLQKTETAIGVISKDLMMEYVDFDSDCNDYGRSDLKEVIEKELPPLLESIFGADNIVSHMVDLTTLDGQKVCENVECKVRPLTFDEARDNNDLLSAELPDWYWTCTAWSTKDRGWGYGIAVVSPSGSINSSYCNFGYGVRPFCILKSNIFVSKGEC